MNRVLTVIRYLGLIFLISCQGASKDQTPLDASATAAAVVNLINSERHRGGTCPSIGSFSSSNRLSWNGQLGRAAQNHAEELLERGVLDHTGKDGSEVSDRIELAGYSYSAAAENLARGPQTASDALVAWLNSSGHCQNILSDQYSEIGVGVAGTGAQTVWVLNFGSP